MRAVLLSIPRKQIVEYRNMRMVSRAGLSSFSVVKLSGRVKLGGKSVQLRLGIFSVSMLKNRNRSHFKSSDRMI